MSRFIGGRELPPVLELLGFELLAADAELGTAEVAFLGRPEFGNLLGGVQGGFVSAMLDAAASCALMTQLPADHLVPTIEMKTSFYRPALPGRLICRGRIVHRGRSIGFVEASMFDTADHLLASLTSTARIVRAER